ncbi:MAG: rhodanese-like domain-containing protein [Planctomycetota bacterium]
MLLKYFYDPVLAHASYLVGCQRAKQAIIVDPGRDIEQYLQAAKREGVEITAIAETHIHADYVSGARELADRAGAKLYVSDEGPAEWKYAYADQYSHQLVHDGDEFMVGNIKFTVMHTPGHTPESISFLVTDQGGGADKPMGIFTGDFVFVGSIGRPDLLEQAAGIANTAEPGARDLFKSIARFKQLPDYLQVWPAHGAGSACGKGLGAIPSSTVGYEKLFNPALQYKDEEEFVRYILADQPEAPTYFAVMKHVNKVGPRVLGAGHSHRILDVKDLPAAVQTGTVIDLSASNEFAAGHVPGSINIPQALLAAWAGWLFDSKKPTYLICSPHQVESAAAMLHKIGVENIFAFDLAAVKAAGLATESYASGTPQDLRHKIEAGQVHLVDVRGDAEWAEGRIEQAEHRFLGRLSANLGGLPQETPIVVQCRSGVRSAVGCSVLQAHGFKNVINLTGGYLAWTGAGYPTTKCSKDTVTA